MPSSSYDFIHNPSLPSDEDIVARCEEHKFPQGITITDPSTHSEIAWVKCGVNVTLGEAHMQHWTAMALREAGISSVQVASVFRAFTADYHGCRVGYITMQYIEGTDCDSKDVDLIARAVEALINLRAPSTATLGHFGSDTSSIVHSFFPEWLPNADYRTDQDFYDHIQKILKMLRIDFQGDISDYDRYLCLSDFNPGNFRKSTTPDGQSVVVVLDFGATCFMPLPFIEVALKKDRDIFRQSLIERIKYPRARSEDVQALLSASYRLVQYGWGPIALPPGVSPRFGRK
ncbi:uncharacterized protein STEHIDRAFT_136955 [Stereum hirsutum FP-91666 SS1]|uniref:uncharacterized protein n=1 Tax=Stereum hirsutum (strain FP-91666) TaxID=721885 RepID=UPI000440A08D|nr:uncharacterized protein STEHIDRAFT_136955 [Stereum hirsutum FP-91666 SS1]EIM91143.1 hypothetical protein STEHIDRAFT_136955 [Stereum hirsutum FP-91666 SS1]